MFIRILPSVTTLFAIITSVTSGPISVPAEMVYTNIPLVERVSDPSKSLSNNEADFNALPTQTHAIHTTDTPISPTPSADTQIPVHLLSGSLKKLINLLYSTGSIPHNSQSRSTPNLNDTCPTPMSLMLHSSFGVERMKSLAQEIIKNNLHTSTYQDLLTNLTMGKCPQEGTIIVSLDDLGTNWLRPVFKDMIEVFTAEGLVLVVGVVVFGPQDPVIWAYLSELESLGVEVASHTTNHYNLPEVDDEKLDAEVSGSYRIICDNLNNCPDTLILPFGNIDQEGKIFKAAQQYTFIIGIAGGISFSGGPPYYFGRISPDITNVEQTMRLLHVTFNIQ